MANDTSNPPRITQTMIGPILAIYDYHDGKFDGPAQRTLLYERIKKSPSLSELAKTTKGGEHGVLEMAVANVMAENLKAFDGEHGEAVTQIISNELTGMESRLSSGHAAKLFGGNIEQPRDSSSRRA
jgi:hypothetical protein